LQKGVSNPQSLQHLLADPESGLAQRGGEGASARLITTGRVLEVVYYLLLPSYIGMIHEEGTLK
jgi:hypothetical protein